jgi:hypothetical protein
MWSVWFGGLYFLHFVVVALIFLEAEVVGWDGGDCLLAWKRVLMW